MANMQAVELTPRQEEVCVLVALGMSNKAIAREIGLSVYTVEVHLSNISQRLPGFGSPRQKIIRLYTAPFLSE